MIRSDPGRNDIYSAHQVQVVMNDIIRRRETTQSFGAIVPAIDNI